jgi:XTP/dITP diphosphohydrolase/tetrapyrrole methylase family protein/MazG family protein/ATP diphosphatase
VGFDWPNGDPSPVIAKVEEELNELKDCIANGAAQEATEEELGDLLFAVANLSRHLKADPEITLHKACVKFSERFRKVEEEVSLSGKEWSDFTLDELEDFWQKAKRQDNGETVGLQSNVKQL